MDCLLVKVTRLKSKGKSSKLKLNTYYPLTVLNSLLEEISRGLNKPQEINLTLVDLENHKEEIQFNKLELSSSFESIIHLLNEDIIKTERDADFDFSSRLRAITASLSKQWDEEQTQIADYQAEADSLNETLFTKVSSYFNKKLPSKQEKIITEEPKIVEEIIPQMVEQTVIIEEQPTIEEIPAVTPVPTITEPVWELEEEEEPFITKTEPTFMKPASQTIPPKQTSIFSFEDYLQTKDETTEVINLLNELEMSHQQPINDIGKRLGINVEAPSLLEKKQLEYLGLTQDQFIFHTLKSNLIENINQLDTALLETLENQYLESGIVEHELNAYVDQLAEIKKIELINQQVITKEELISKLDTERTSKVSGLLAKQTAELESLKAKQADDHQRLDSDITLYEENEKEKLSNQQRIELEQGLEEYKFQTKESRKEELSVKLTSDKAHLLVQRQDAVTKEVQETVKELDTILKGIKFQLIEKQAQFEEVVSKEEANRIQQEMHNLREMELKVKQEELKARHTKHDNGELQRQQQYDIMMATLQAQIIQGQPSSNQASSPFPEKIDVNLPGEMNQVKKPEGWVKNSLCGAGVVVLLCGGLLGTQLYQASQQDKEHQSELAIMKQNNERLSSTVSSLAEEKTTLQAEISNNQQSLAYLLSVEDYETALNSYGNELDKIETAMFENSNKDSLKAFNEKHESLFGRLDEAILNADDKAILKVYHSLPTDTKLSASRKSHVISALYKLDEITEAKKLIKE